jgi:hypothetical protein
MTTLVASILMYGASSPRLLRLRTMRVVLTTWSNGKLLIPIQMRDVLGQVAWQP